MRAKDVKSSGRRKAEENKSRFFHCSSPKMYIGFDRIPQWRLALKIKGSCSPGLISRMVLE